MSISAVHQPCNMFYLYFYTAHAARYYFSKNLLVYYWKCYILIGYATRYLFVISKIVIVYNCKCCNLIGYATRYLFINRYRVAASNATRSIFFAKKQCFQNNFEEITNTSLFLLKQLDYSLSISMKHFVNLGFALVNYH